MNVNEAFQKVRELSSDILAPMPDADELQVFLLWRDWIDERIEHLQESLKG